MKLIDESKDCQVFMGIGEKEMNSLSIEKH